MASACRYAKFCVSRAMWRADSLFFMPCICCAYLLVRRKILRLYLVSLRWKNMFFSQIIAVALACRDARFCVSRAMWRAGSLCFIPCIYCASLLVRRKILRLYLVSLRRENMFFLNSLRWRPPVDTQNFASPVQCCGLTVCVLYRVYVAHPCL